MKTKTITEVEVSKEKRLLESIGNSKAFKDTCNDIADDDMNGRLLFTIQWVPFNTYEWEDDKSVNGSTRHFEGGIPQISKNRDKKDLVKEKNSKGDSVIYEDK